ncbi:MAG: ComEC/Rec2 family competence protein [Fulvivirga sp.]
MLHWIPYALVRITICFIAGILTAICAGEFLPADLTIWAVVFLVAVYFLSRWLLKKKFFSRNNVIAIVGFTTIYLLGYFNLISSDQRIWPEHIIHEKDEVTYYLATVQKPGEERANTTRYEVDVVQYKTHTGWKESRGKIYLYMDKQHDLLYGDRLLITGKPQEISSPQNPGEFDYRRFLSFKNIYHQHFLRQGDFVVLNNKVPNLLLAYSFQAREWASDALAQNIMSSRELGIAQALVLGVKDGLDNEVQKAYAASGAMHVLAVSGLHVGIIYGIVLLLFGKLQHQKTGRWVLALISLLILWSYAMITGFSPSVLRAVTMFSFVAVAKATGRSTNIYNTLAASAFFLLLFDPYLIMSVGFQLSFLAVLGIVYIQPKLYNIIIPSTVLMDKIWSITTVAVAAQLATFPLGIYYFHQFPTFFFLSNLVVIPGAFIILSLGLAVIAVSFFETVAAWIGTVLEGCIYLVNEAVFALEGLPHAQILNIHMTVFETWLIFGITVFLLIFFQFKKLSYAWFSLVLALIFSGVRITNLLQPGDKIIFYKISNHTAIDFITDRNSIIYSDPELKNNEDKISYHITPNHLISNIMNTVWMENGDMPFIENVKGLKLACWRNKTILILDEQVHKSLKLLNQLEVDYVLICSRFNNDLVWIMKNFDFEKIILDGSLSWYRANELKGELNTLEMPYYSVYHDGAYEIKI